MFHLAQLVIQLICTKGIYDAFTTRFDVLVTSISLCDPVSVYLNVITSFKTGLQKFKNIYVNVITFF
jgi:hypothetical protein